MSHAIAAVRSNRILGVDSAGHNPDIKVMLRAAMVVRARAEGGGGDFVHVRPVSRFLHGKQPAGLLSLALQLLKQN